MKKLSGFISALALLVSMAACQNEVQPVETFEDTVTATIDVVVPDALKTKAYGDASDLTSVNYEIWNEDFTEIVKKDVVTLDGEHKATLELKLIRFKTYNVLFWAQGPKAKHTWTNLKQINIDYTANVENDAFAGRVLGINATSDMNLAHKVTLSRPFAQMNFATDDLGNKGVSMGDLALKSAKVTVPGLATTYDVINGIGLTAKEVVFTSETVLPEAFVMNQVNYDHIMVCYPLVADVESATLNLKAEFEVTCANEVIAVSWTGKGAMNNVPVQANYRTNFYGSLFTNSGNIEIKVDKEFTGVVEPNFDIETKSIADLTSAAEGTYLIEGAVTAVQPVSAGLESVTVADASGSDITLTLSTEQADVAVKSVATHYQVGDVIKIIIEKTAKEIVPLEVLNHTRDVADIYLDVAAGKNVTLTEDVEINHGPLVVGEGQELIIDLGTYTLSNGKELWNSESKDWSLISVKGGKLTLKGTEGALKAMANDCFAVDVRDGGELVIEGGNYVGNISAVYVHEGTATIKGGTFSVQQKSEFSDDRYVLNCYDENYAAGTAKISVTGGTFEGFNPQNNLAEGTATDFVADGYVATADGTKYTVAEKPALPALATGEYWIVYDGKYMYPGNESAKFYYGNLEENGYKDNVFTITAVEGGYTIQDSYGRYLYQSGTYTSFNVNASMPGTGAVWTIVTNEDNTYSVTNGQYFMRYSSYGNLDMTLTESEAVNVSLVNASAATVRPVLNLSATKTSVEATSTSYTLNITSNLAWTVTPSNGASVNPASGNGNGAVEVTFDANSTSESKTYTITVSAEGIADKTLTITQNGVSTGSGSTLTLSKNTIDTSSWTRNGYGTQNVTDLNTYLSWTVNSVNFIGAKLCLPQAGNNYDNFNAIQGQGNTDATKQSRLGNTTALNGNIKKITIITYNTSKYTPNFNLALGTSQVVGTAAPDGMIEAASMSTTSETVGENVKYTTVYEPTADFTYFAIYKNTSGALYFSDIIVEYE